MRERVALSEIGRLHPLWDCRHEGPRPARARAGIPCREPHIDPHYDIAVYGRLTRMHCSRRTPSRVGLVGTPRAVEGLRGWLQRCQFPIDAKEAKPGQEDLRLPYLGLQRASGEGPARRRARLRGRRPTCPPGLPALRHRCPRCRSSLARHLRLQSRPVPAEPLPAVRRRGCQLLAHDAPAIANADERARRREVPVAD